MKFTKTLLTLVVCVSLTMTSCTVRLVDFTVISSKNVNMKKVDGVKVEATKTYFLGIGWNIKDALDEALEKAGKDYDLLVDGVVRYGSYFFVLTVSVEGTAVSSEKMKAALGDAGYQEWINTHSIFDPNQAPSQKTGEQ